MHIDMKSMIEPVMAATLEPGLAWMVMATEEGGTERIQAGKLLLVLGVGFADRVDSAAELGLALALAFPFLAGAISLLLLLAPRHLAQLTRKDCIRDT